MTSLSTFVVAQISAGNFYDKRPIVAVRFLLYFVSNRGARFVGLDKPNRIKRLGPGPKRLYVLDKFLVVFGRFRDSKVVRNWISSVFMIGSLSTHAAGRPQPLTSCIDATVYHSRDGCWNLDKRGCAADCVLICSQRLKRNFVTRSLEERVKVRGQCD